MHRDRIILLLAPVALAVAATVGCTTSLPIDRTTTGVAGETAAGAAGQSAGAAGAQGAAGSTSGAAGAGAAGAGAAGAGAAGAGVAGAGAAGAGAAGAGAAGAGAAGAGTDAGAVLSFATDILPIINTNCHDCHQTGKDGNLDLTAANAYKSLVGTGTGGAVLANTTCTLLDAKKLRVSPGDPTHSMIYIKITIAQAMLTTDNCNNAMPKGKPQLGAMDTQKIHDWIMGGANP